MEKTTVSQKFQIVIPKEVREIARLKPKEELAIWIEGDIIHLTPVKKIKNPTAVMSSLTKKRIRVSIEQLEKGVEEEYE